MKKALKRFNILLFILLMQKCITSCDEIFEKNLSGAEIFMISPGEDCITTFSSQAFLWEPVNGATQYVFQIVSPSFNVTELLLADTILTKNRFNINLFPGKFEWRVRAENGSSSSAYFIRTLEIDSTRDLKGHQVNLINPEDDRYLNSGAITFRWDNLYNAEFYTFKLYKNEWKNDPVFSIDSLHMVNVTAENLEEGSYVWGVMAFNSTSSTIFSKRDVHVDRTPPNPPDLTAPENREILNSQNILFSWNNNQDNGSPLTDSLLLSSDSLFRSGNAFLKKIKTESPFNISLQDTGMYFWRVKSTDSAGNQGQFSQIFRFKLHILN